MNAAIRLSSKWFACPRSKPQAATRLFFLPYAGGGPAVFTGWCAELPAHIEGQVVHYPGRGSRFNEDAVTGMPRMVDELANAIQPWLDRPFAFFGHSMGGLIAYELAHLLRARSLPTPDLLFVSACGAPHLPDPNPKIHQLPDDEFLSELDQLNGIPAELKHPEAMDLLLPVVRADFQLIETYVYNPARPPLDFPILALGALDDPRISRERIEGWAAHTASAFTARYFPGGHFFIHHARQPILEFLYEKIRLTH